MNQPNTNRITSALLGGIAAALLALPAVAQMGPGAGMGGMGGTGPGGATGPGPRVADCSKAPDKATCEAHNKALEVCGTQRGPAHRECMEDNMPAADCSKAPNPAQCANMQAARAACKGKYGPERAACLRQQQPAAGQRGMGGGMGPGQRGMGGMGPGMGGMGGMGPGMGPCGIAGAPPCPRAAPPAKP